MGGSLRFNKGCSPRKLLSGSQQGRVSVTNSNKLASTHLHRRSRCPTIPLVEEGILLHMAPKPGSITSFRTLFHMEVKLHDMITEFERLRRNAL